MTTLLKRIFVGVMLGVFASLHPVIVESNDITDILKHFNGTPDLVLLDLDNTLVETPSGEGSDQWFYALKQQYCKQGYGELEAIAQVLPQYIAIQNKTDLVLVDARSLDVLKELSQRGAHVVALTARSLPLVERTLEQLHHLGIDFSATKFGSDTHHITGLHEPARYLQGVIFCGNNNKGDVLMDLFDQYSYHPRTMIFVDDKGKYLQAVQTCAQSRGIDFVGIRYGRCDEKVAHFVLPQPSEKTIHP